MTPPSQIRFQMVKIGKVKPKHPILSRLQVRMIGKVKHCPRFHVKMMLANVKLGPVFQQFGKAKPWKIAKVKVGKVTLANPTPRQRNPRPPGRRQPARPAGAFEAGQQPGRDRTPA